MTDISAPLVGYFGTEMEELFRNTFDAAPIGMAIVDMDNRLREVNQGFCEMLGYTRAELIQKCLVDITHAEDIEIDLELSAKVFNGEIPSYHLDKRYLKKNGEPLWASLTAAVIRDRGGRILYRLSMIQDVTERRNAEDALALERNLLRTLIDNVPDYMYVKDTQSRFVVGNQAIAQSFGKTTPEEIYGRTDFDYHQRESATRFFADERAVLNSGEPLINREEFVVEATGREKWITTTKVPLRDSQGKVIGLVGVGHDVTEQKRAQDALAASERELRALFAAMSDVILVYDRQGRYLQIAPTNPTLLIKPPSELLGRTVHEVMPAAEADYIVDQIRLALEKKHPLPIQYTLPIESSAVRFEGTVSPMGNDRVFWIVRDVTERKHAEEALRVSEERFHSAFDHAAIGMALVAPDGRWLKVNRALCRLTGYSELELLSKTFQDITHPDDLDADLEYVHRLLAKDISTYQMEKRYIHKLGHAVWVLLSVSLVCDAQGLPLYFISQIQDIDERKRMEVELKDTNEKLTIWVNQLRQRSQEIALLSQMGDLLQSCLNAEEAHKVIAHSVHLLFPSESGALYVINSSRNLAERMAVWGEHPPIETMFTPDDCWALRRGQLYGVEEPATEVICAHLALDSPFTYLCVPMIAQGETLGVLHLRRPASGGDARSNGHDPAGESFASSRQQLAVGVAEHIALSLASLRLRDTLRSQAIRDPLTGLFNRRYMEETIERELHRAARNAAPLGIIMFDVDNLKNINDNFGHPAGDVVLRELGAHLQARIRRDDIACRYGGDEFILVLPECSLETTLQRADQLREEFKSLGLTYHGHVLPRGSLSLGVAVFTSYDTNAESLLHRADQALYRAKSGGRDRVVVAD